MRAPFHSFNPADLRLAMAQVPAVALPPPAPRHTLLLAGPGAGKTTALVNHAADLLARGACRPQEIVMLAFTRVAEEQLRLRLLEKIGEAGRDICIRTFHGLAADIVAQVNGRKPRLSPLADAPQAQAQLLEAAIQNRMASDAVFRQRALSFFAWHLHPAREALDFSSWDDLRAHLRTLDLRTLAGERVRSRGEWLIANWLFLRGIAYVYERPIPPALLPAGGNYRPDFFLPDHGVYIEHLGLDRAGQPPAFMDPARYLAQLQWKRAWHGSQPTRLVETCAWESAEGTLPRALETRLAQVGVRAQPLAWEALQQALHPHHTVSRLAALAESFLRLTAATGETLATCRARVCATRWRERHANFLDLLEPLAAARHAALTENGATDFDGLIAQATQAVRSGAWANPFVAVLVDEAQDLSSTRAQLLAALVGARGSALASPPQPARAEPRAPSLYAVGDDRQAIFGFSGTDAALLRRFKSVFGDSRLLELRGTHRLNASLAAIAESFIARDPRHTRAAMRAARQGPHDPVRVVYAKHTREGATEALAQIVAENPAASVLLLARTGATLRACQVENLRRRFPTLAITAKTIHAAKGMEADCAVILDLVEGRFPSSKTGDPLLHLAHAALHEPYPHAEERRLFFVALTRARHGVWLVADKDKPSPFVAETMRMAQVAE